MNQASSDPRDEELISDQHLNDAVQFLLAGLEHCIKFLGLRDSTGEAVQHEPKMFKIDVSRVVRRTTCSQAKGGS